MVQPVVSELSPELHDGQNKDWKIKESHIENRKGSVSGRGGEVMDKAEEAHCRHSIP